MPSISDWLAIQKSLSDPNNPRKEIIKIYRRSVAWVKYSIFTYTVIIAYFIFEVRDYENLYVNFLLCLGVFSLITAVGIVIITEHEIGKYGATHHIGTVVTPAPKKLINFRQEFMTVRENNGKTLLLKYWKPAYTNFKSGTTISFLTIDRPDNQSLNGALKAVGVSYTKR